MAIMAAMDAELRGVLELLGPAERREYAGRTFWSGRFAGHEVVAVLARIGKVAAATTTTALLTNYEVDRVLFTGLAGGVGDEVQVGDVVVAQTLLQHDLDASPLFPRFDVPLTGKQYFDTDAELEAALATAAAEFVARDGDRLHRGLIVSGDVFVSTQKARLALRQRLERALAVEMEGAAVAQVCYDFGIPLGVVRTVSDRADDHAPYEFTRSLCDRMSRRSAEIIRRALELLPFCTDVGHGMGA